MLFASHTQHLKREKRKDGRQDKRKAETRRKNKQRTEDTNSDVGELREGSEAVSALPVHSIHSALEAIRGDERASVEHHAVAANAFVSVRQRRETKNERQEERRIRRTEREERHANKRRENPRGYLNFIAQAWQSATGVELWTGMG
jgi:hypothetical protein